MCFEAINALFSVTTWIWLSTVLSLPHTFFHRYKLLRYSRERQYIDGLNNLLYTPTLLVNRLYTNITVDLVPELAPVQDYWWNTRINYWMKFFCYKWKILIWSFMLKDPNQFFLMTWKTKSNNDDIMTVCHLVKRNPSGCYLKCLHHELTNIWALFDYSFSLKPLISKKDRSVALFGSQEKHLLPGNVLSTK